MAGKPPAFPAFARAGEFTAIFILLPLLGGLLAEHLKRWVLPQIWLLALLCLILLLRDPAFDSRRLRRLPERLSPCLRRLAWIFVPGALLLLLWALASPDLDPFGLPREKTGLWLAVLVFYPLLSALPQELIFRAFIFHRYRTVFTTPRTMILASAASFGLAHLILGNAMAPVVSVLGGALFAYTYWKSRSLPLVGLEHALWGDWLFTLGYGRYFYGGHI
jgi:hypothetical protein